MIYETDKLKNINPTALQSEALECTEYALKTNNLKIRYQYFQKGKTISKIAKDIEKWQIMTRGY